MARAVAASTLLPLLLGATSPSTHAQCNGELLHNGICLPTIWPPRHNFTASAKEKGLIEPPHPSYLQGKCHPPTQLARFWPKHSSP